MTKLLSLKNVFTIAAISSLFGCNSSPSLCSSPTSESIAQEPTWREEPVDVSLKLHFPTLTAKGETVENLLAHTLHQEDVQLDAACPEHILNHRIQSQKSWISRLPEYVIIHFVRTRFQDDGTSVRLPTTIIIKPELDFSNFGRPRSTFKTLYSLVCDIRHIGSESSPESGHYIAYSKLAVGWIRCDDERISSDVPWAGQQDEASYLLLYKCNNWIRGQDLDAGNATTSPQSQVNLHEESSPMIISDNSNTPSAPRSSNLLVKDIVGIDSFDPYKQKYTTSIKRYFAQCVGEDGICSHTDLLVNTFDGLRKKDGTQNNEAEILALLKIWWEALSAVADIAEVSHRLNMWKLKPSQLVVPDALSGSDRNTWDVSITESELKMDIGDQSIVPTRIWGTSYQLGVMCFRVSWTHVPGLKD